MIKDLREAPLLSGLTDEQLKGVAQRAVRMRLREGQFLFCQGDPADRFYLVLAGRMRLFRLSPDGGEKVIEIVGPGETFAEALMFLDAPRYPVCAAALGQVELIGIDAADFAQMLRGSIDTCFILLGKLSQRLRGLLREIDNLTLHTAISRLARYLLAKRPAGEREMNLEARKGVIASRLSIKPETFSRIEKELTKQGVIAVKGQRVTFLDLDALERIAALRDSEELTPLPCMTPFWL
jgi:CRP-like cAMP-binding protein